MCLKTLEKSYFVKILNQELTFILKNVIESWISKSYDFRFLKDQCVGFGGDLLAEILAEIEYKYNVRIFSLVYNNVKIRVIMFSLP